MSTATPPIPGGESVESGLVTGGGAGTRKFYTNTEESLMKAKRPVLLNGIERFVTRGDLLDRSLVIRVPFIEHVRTEADIWAAFEAAHPELLGALFDAAVTALQTPEDRSVPLPRMVNALLGMIP